MSARLTRRQSDAIEPAAATAGSAKPTRKSAASPAGSRKKKGGAAANAAATAASVAASSVRSPSPAPVSASAAASPSRVRRGRQPAATTAAARAATPDRRATARSTRHVNSKDADEKGEEEGAERQSEEDGDSDLESVGSRASHQPLRSRSQAKSPRLGYTHARSPPAPLEGLFLESAGERGVRWDEAAESPTGAGTDVLPSGYLPGAVPPRKGSDHRRATVAAQKREEAARLEASYKALVSAALAHPTGGGRPGHSPSLDDLTSTHQCMCWLCVFVSMCRQWQQAAQEEQQRSQKGGCCRSLLRFVLWTVSTTALAKDVATAAATAATIRSRRSILFLLIYC